MKSGEAFQNRLHITSAIKGQCENRNIKIILMAPFWPNQAQFSDLLDVSIVFPLSLHDHRQAVILLPLSSGSSEQDSTRRSIEMVSQACYMYIPETILGRSL